MDLDILGIENKDRIIRRRRNIDEAEVVSFKSTSREKYASPTWARNPSYSQEVKSGLNSSARKLVEELQHLVESLPAEEFSRPVGRGPEAN